MYMLSVPGTSTSHAEGISSFDIMLMMVQGHHAEELLHRGPTLHGADGHVRLLHPSVDHRTQLGHLEQRRVRNAIGADIRLDGGQLRLRSIIVILHAD